MMDVVHATVYDGRMKRRAGAVLLAVAAVGLMILVHTMSPGAGTVWLILLAGGLIFGALIAVAVRDVGYDGPGNVYSPNDVAAARSANDDGPAATFTVSQTTERTTTTVQGSIPIRSLAHLANQRADMILTAQQRAAVRAAATRAVSPGRTTQVRSDDTAYLNGESYERH